MRWTIAVLITYFLYFELRCIIRDGILYLTDIFNYIDITSFSLNIYIIENAVQGNISEEDKAAYLRALNALAVLLLWTKSFYWLRLFGPTSFFVRMILEVLKDIRVFMILFVLILMTFGNAMLILSDGRETPLFKDYFETTYLNVVLNQYELSLGEFDTDERFTPASEGGDPIAWGVFCLATLITQIVFLNLLIAIMGDTFERVTESREQSALVEKIRILADYVFVVPREDQSKKTKNRFLFAILPRNLG